jgi:hypothetical protein
MQTIGNFGVPLKIRSDGGAEFCNAILSALAGLLGTTQHKVVAYTPTANSIVERANRAILEKLRDMIFDKALVLHTESQWSDLLPLAQRIINGSYHSSIGTSPASILFGGSIDLNRCLLSKMPRPVLVDVETYVGALVNNQRVLIEAAEKHHEKVCSKVLNKAENDHGDKIDKPINANDWVVVHPVNRPLHKLAPRLIGPYAVVGVKGEIVSCLNPVDKKVRQFLKRNCELFDASMTNGVEGMLKVAERDNFEYPIEAIIGHALITDEGFGEGDIRQLPANHKRSVKKAAYQFLVKWVGHDEATWQPYKHASKFVHFPEYVSRYPGLNMSE